MSAQEPTQKVTTKSPTGLPAEPGNPDVGAGLAILSAAQAWAHDHHVPLNATVEITQRCNIRCQHCYNFDRDERRPSRTSPSGCEVAPELDTAEILQLITDLHRAGCLFLSLTGGEAMVHPDLFAFLDHAAGLNMAVHLLSNGTLLRPGMVGRLAGYPNLLRVSISLYGATAEVHDEVTQARGSFARTWAGVRLLQARGIVVRVKFIVMRGNAHQMEEMVAQADAAKLPYTVDFTVTARHDGTRGSLDNRIDRRQLEQLCHGPLRHMIRLGAERTFTATEFACNCARGNCAVSAQGDVQPCISVPLVAGNIRKQPFAEIWRSSPVFQWIRGLRVEDYPQCSPCPHKSWCTRDRGAALTYSGSYTGTDPLVCARAEIAHQLADEARTT
jgi:radical SAM protein with 4Fe4S-binding SPASM domain